MVVASWALTVFRVEVGVRAAAGAPTVFCLTLHSCGDEYAVHMYCITSVTLHLEREVANEAVRCCVVDDAVPPVYYVLYECHVWRLRARAHALCVFCVCVISQVLLLWIVLPRGVLLASPL